MKYFVSIENTSYFHWQIELLIESFKHHGIQDELVIAIAENNEPVIPEYKKNILSHKNKFTHAPMSPQCLNKFYALLLAMDQGLIDLPFCMIHPDMILTHPVPDKLELDNDILFSQSFDVEPFKEPLNKYIAELQERTNIANLAWIPVGDVVVFRNAPRYVFERLYLNCEKLATEELPVKLEKAVWILTLSEAMTGLISEKPLSLGIINLEQTMLHQNMTAFIHYKHGIPPEFSKYQFKFNEPISLVTNEHGPYDAILENNISSATQYVASIIEKYKFTSNSE